MWCHSWSLGRWPPHWVNDRSEHCGTSKTSSPCSPHRRGSPARTALHIYRVLFAYLYGHLLTELQEVIERPEETDHVLRLGLHRLSITDFPHVRALAGELGSYDGSAELDRGLNLLLPGLQSALPQRLPPKGDTS